MNSQSFRLGTGQDWRISASNLRRHRSNHNNANICYGLNSKRSSNILGSSSHSAKRNLNISAIKDKRMKIL